MIEEATEHLKAAHAAVTEAYVATGSADLPIDLFRILDQLEEAIAYLEDLESET